MARAPRASAPMSLASILNASIGEGAAGGAESIEVSVATLQSVKDDFDKMLTSFKNSHDNFERVMQENEELKRKMARMQMKLEELLTVQSRHNAEVTEQRNTIQSLRHRLFVHTGIQLSGDLGVMEAEDGGLEWLDLDMRGDDQRGGDDQRRGDDELRGDATGLPVQSGIKRGAVDPLSETDLKGKKPFLGTGSDRVKQPAPTTRVLKVHTASVEAAVQAFLNTVPIFDVSEWRFKDKTCALEFWTAVKDFALYNHLEENLRLKSAKKTLNALGYDMQTPAEFWQEALVWGWNCARAMINCYWLNTTVSLDGKVKNVLKIVSKHYNEVGRVVTASPYAASEFPERNKEQMMPFVSNLFVFKVDNGKVMRVEKRKMEEIVEICKLLRSFHQQHKIVECTVFRPWTDLEGDLRTSLQQKLQTFASAERQTVAP